MHRHHPNHLALLGGTALSLLLALPALAQETAPVFLGTLTFGVLGADPVGDNANPLTLTGVRTATPLTEVPQSVSVVSAEDIAETNATKLDEALRYTAGVQAAPYGHDSDTNWVFIRGFNATQTGVFMDGATFNNYGYGAFYIDPFLVERVEVLRGPSSMLYGGSNPGGIVNYVSRLPGGEPGRVVEAGVEDNGTAWTSLDWGDAISDSTSYRFGAKLQQTDGNGMFDPGQNVVLSGGIAHAFGNGGILTVTANYTRSDETHVGGAWLPYVGTVVDAPFGRIDRDFNSGEPDYDSYTRDQTLLTAIYRQELAGGWQLTDTFRVGRAEVDESMVYAGGYGAGPWPAEWAATPQDPAGLLSRVVFDQTSVATMISNDLTFTGEIAAGAVTHELLFGVGTYVYESDQVQAWASGSWGGVPPLSADDPVYGGALPATAAQHDNVITQSQIGLYAQDQMRFGDGWLATLNARYDFVRADATANAATGVDGMVREDGEFTWRAALSRQIGSVTPYLTFGTYFNPQVRTTPLGAGVEPETGAQVEAGVKWSPDQDTLLTAALFHVRRENVSYDIWNPAAPGFYDYVEIGEVRSSGFELSYEGRLSDSLTMNAAVTLMDVEIANDYDAAIIGNTPKTVVEDQASVSLSWSPEQVEGLTLTGGVRYQGASWADNANMLEVPAVTLYDAGAGWDFAEGWTANLHVANIADETYVQSCESATNCYYGEGRNISLTLRHSF